MINSNFGVWTYLVPFSRYWRIKLENSLLSPPHPCVTPSLKGNPSEFLDEAYAAKTRGMGLLYGENSMTLCSTVFHWSTRVTDGRTTDRRAMAYTRYSIYAVARKKSLPACRAAVRLPVYGRLSLVLYKSRHRLGALFSPHQRNACVPIWVELRWLYNVYI